MKRAVQQTKRFEGSVKAGKGPFSTKNARKERGIQRAIQPNTNDEFSTQGSKNSTPPSARVEHANNINPPTAHAEHLFVEATDANASAECPTKRSTPLTARVEHANNANPPTAQMDHPVQHATQPSADAEHPAQRSAPRTARVEHAKHANPPTAHMEHHIQRATQPSTDTEHPAQDPARTECPTIAKLTLPTLLMKLLPQKLNDFLSFPTPPDPADPVHHDLAAFTMTWLRCF
jgi:hypothetical protein